MTDFLKGNRLEDVKRLPFKLLPLMHGLKILFEQTLTKLQSKFKHLKLYNGALFWL